MAVIGHTGRGNYGHGLDTVWQKIDGAQIVAVADANADGLAKEQAKLKVDGGYTDYRKMLAEVKPEFVSVCPRHADQHHAMALASIEAGVRGVYVEKPLCRTPGEADALVAACDRRGARLAVAHRNRYHPALQVIDRLIADGGIGKLLEIRGRGKGDRRGGAEDLWVLGSHVLNLTAYFGGDPRTCSAVMRAKGRPVTKADVIDGAEGLGPLAGDELHARYEMSSGVIAYFDSIANDGTHNAGFGLQLVGSEGVVNIQCDLDPVAHLWRGNPFQPSTEPRAWTPITSAGVGAAENQPELIAAVQHHEAAVRDLIDAVDHDRAPICDIGAGRTTVEMVCAVFESHRQGGAAVAFPLTERDNALRKL
ncbi:MAG: gfo/Idh/MocA family oxidoreductase [Phycisphaera sp.]|nr:gfo/Idh/MocA family oxidoreductase [Phycisphaera sp.]